MNSYDDYINETEHGTPAPPRKKLNERATIIPQIHSIVYNESDRTAKERVKGRKGSSSGVAGMPVGATISNL
jgi:hypothetical protein